MTRATGAPPAPARGPRAAAVLASTLVPLAAYALTLHTGLPAGDSGELITAAWTFGVAHPPGYPLYVVLGGLWAHALPFGSPAVRLALLSAVSMALAAGVLAAAVSRLTGSRVAGVVAAWVFAFSAPAWTMAIVAEVFALNALLGALVLAACARALAPRPAPAARPPLAPRRAPPGPRRDEEPAPPAPERATPALALLAGLSLSLHHTLLMLALPATVAALAAGWPRAAAARARWARRVALAALASLVPLIVLPLAARHAGALAWGDATTPRGFLSLLLRWDYGTLRLDPAQAGLHADRSHFALYLAALPHDVGWPALALALGGAAALAGLARGGPARPRALAWALAAYALLQAAFFARVGFPSGEAWLRGVVERFYVLPDLVLALLAGLGAAWALARVPAPRAARAGAAVALLGAALAWPVATHGLAVSQRGNDFAGALGRGMLASLPQGAVLFVRGDLLHDSLVYLTRVEGLRPDVVVLDEELMTYGWYVRRVRATHPDALPPLGGAQRIALRDGRRIDGWAVPRADGSVDVLAETGEATLAAADVAGIAPAQAESLFRATRAGFDSGPLSERTEDRYSGLPGTRSLLWVDHLSGRRAVAFAGLKDGSVRMRYGLTPVGFTTWARPLDAPPGALEQCLATLRVLEATPFDPYFRAYDPGGFEAAERWRFPAFAARAALVLSQPEAAPLRAAHPLAYGRLLAFARRFEALEPSPDPLCLRALGFLHACDAPARDLARARLDLERYLASGDPAAAHDVEARAALAHLAAIPAR